MICYNDIFHLIVIYFKENPDSGNFRNIIPLLANKRKIIELVNPIKSFKSMFVQKKH